VACAGRGQVLLALKAIEVSFGSVGYFPALMGSCVRQGITFAAAAAMRATPP
jgi:hypothetical protein